LVGGVNAYVSSDVMNASGLSSSAAIEMLFGQILNDFYNDGNIDLLSIAKIGQFAENNYWNKQSGLLDQIACGFGGLVYLDFQDSDNPHVQRVNYDFNKEGYSLVIVNTGGNHADLTDEYSSVPLEMWSVARHLGKKRCIELSYKEIVDAIPRLRGVVGDRAILRTLHFFEENERVMKQVNCLEHDNFPEFLNLITESGSSSWRLLQNCYDITHPTQQHIPLALALTEHFLSERNASGAFRVHGGGFAGTILAALPIELLQPYVDFIEPILGVGSVIPLGIREYGSVNVSALMANQS
jgi:galactokinase